MFSFSTFVQLCKRFFGFFVVGFLFFLAFKLLTSWGLVVGCVYGLILGLEWVWSSRHLHWSQTKQQVVRVVGFWSSLTFVFFCLYFSVILWCSTLDKVFSSFFWFSTFFEWVEVFFCFPEKLKNNRFKLQNFEIVIVNFAFFKIPPQNNEQENLQYFCLFVTAF